MTRGSEPIAVLVAVVVAAGAMICLGFVIVNNQLQSLRNEIAANTIAPVDVSGWQTYENDQYGFELEYPPGWTLYTDGLNNDTPFIAFGNPLEGVKTYALDVFLESNPNALSSGAYAHAVIDATKAVDTANSASGSAPRTAPKFGKSYVLTVGGYPAYELFDVFEFDHNAERIYVAHGNEALHFDFPMAQENGNLSLPVANNGIAHEIMNTLVFTK